MFKWFTDPKHFHIKDANAQSTVLAHNFVIDGVIFVPNYDNNEEKVQRKQDKLMVTDTVRDFSPAQVI